MNTETYHNYAPKYSDIPRCQASTEKRDAYRYSGRGSSGFTLRYSHPQCVRKSIEGSEYCRQHETRHFPCINPGGPRPFMEVKQQPTEEQKQAQVDYDRHYGADGHRRNRITNLDCPLCVTQKSLEKS